MGWKQKVEANRVTFKRPFYIGVFEVTQKQYALVTGQKPSKYPGEMRPLDTISWEKLRGPASVHNWPEVNTVASDSFIGRIRARPGLDGFDLPTQAQWEYVCRAGTTTDRYDGSKYTRDKMWRDSIDHCYRLGRCAVNQKLKGYKKTNWVKHNPDGKGGFYEASTIVGMYLLIPGDFTTCTGMSWKYACRNNTIHGEKTGNAPPEKSSKKVGHCVASFGATL